MERGNLALVSLRAKRGNLIERDLKSSRRHDMPSLLDKAKFSEHNE